jgi:hypothetical protein
MRLPAKEGVTSKTLEKQDGIPYHAMKVSQATGLTDLVEEYAFFTPALLFTHGEWTSDPIEDYVRTSPACCPFAIDLPRPVFHGLRHRGNPSWNYRIMACPRDTWPGLYSHLCGLGGINRDRWLFHRMLPQQIPIVDVLALERKAVLPSPVPMVDIITFGLDGNNRQVYFAPAFNPPQDLPHVKVGEADTETIRLAEAHFAESPRPFSAVQPSLGEAMVEMFQAVKEARRGDQSPGSAGLRG